MPTSSTLVQSSNWPPCFPSTCSSTTLEHVTSSFHILFWSPSTPSYSSILVRLRDIYRRSPSLLAMHGTRQSRNVPLTTVSITSFWTIAYYQHSKWRYSFPLELRFSIIIRYYSCWLINWCYFQKHSRRFFCMFTLLMSWCHPHTASSHIVVLTWCVFCKYLFVRDKIVLLVSSVTVLDYTYFHYIVRYWWLIFLYSVNPSIPLLILWLYFGIQCSWNGA